MPVRSPAQTRSGSFNFLWAKLGSEMNGGKLQIRGKELWPSDTRVEGLNVYSQGAAWWCVRPGLEEVSLEESPDIDAEVLTIQLKCLSTG